MCTLQIGRILPQIHFARQKFSKNPCQENFYKHLAPCSLNTTDSPLVDLCVNITFFAWNHLELMDNFPAAYIQVKKINNNMPTSLLSGI